mmetsp:Transcript_2232/g.5102  ORF Transcript_2232/g.5102 Transcript_2232/m.5102 type:complete len:107 (+) Transcript_2232:164-484(+)
MNEMISFRFFFSSFFLKPKKIIDNRRTDRTPKTTNRSQNKKVAKTFWHSFLRQQPSPIDLSIQIKSERYAKTMMSYLSYPLIERSIDRSFDQRIRQVRHHGLSVAF